MRIAPLLTLLLTILLATGTMPLCAQDRAKMNPDYQWRPEHIYPTVDAWQKDLAVIRSGLPKLAAYRGHFAKKLAKEAIKDLLAYNKLSKDLSIRMERAVNYVQYHVDVAMNDAIWNGRRQEIEQIAIDFSQKTAWLEPELLEIPRETLVGWTNQNQELAPYRKTYEDMYTLRAHSLSTPEEELLALAGTVVATPSDVFEVLTTVDLDYGMINDENDKPIKVSDAGWVSFRTNKNRAVRENYFNALWAQYKKHENTFAAVMKGNIQKDLFLAKARHFPTTLDQALTLNHIPTSVYENLISTTRKNLAPLHRLDALRKRVLGIDHYRHWDYYVNFAKAAEKRVSWEDAVSQVKNSLAPLGTTYLKDLEHALNAKNGWVDVYENQAKRSGAYSSSTYGIHPYMLYNFDSQRGLTLDDVSTVAHEVGHTLHSYYSEKGQPWPNQNYAIFNAEVASTTNETLFAIKLLDDARAAYAKAPSDAKERTRENLIALLEQNIKTGRDTFFRQAMFATWEWEAHKMAEAGKPLTAESFSKLYGDLLKEWHGEAAEYGELSSVSWAMIPHFYNAYYVYSYATSYAAAVSLAQDIRAEAMGNPDKKGATARFLAYLASGSSKHPVELLKDGGVDMTSPAPIEAFIKYWTGLVVELESLYP